VLLSRRTWRGFGRARVALRDLALILDLTWGVRGWGEAGHRDRVVVKTSPSSGSRHPIEAYVLSLRVEGLRRGLYHYVSDRHALEVVREGVGVRRLRAYLCDQWWYEPAAAVVFMTARLDRSRWRYPFARAYRSVLMDAGHLGQTFCLVATWLGLAPFCTAALADSRIEKDLGVDGFDEVVLYAAGVGTRPAGMKGKAWVQWPEHRPGHPYLPPARRSRTRA
jgi:SagB-type dehydrogenase family enzyme